MDRDCCLKREIHPRETANIFSLLSFFYIIKLFKKGYSKGLENEDLYEVIPKCRSKKVGNRLEKFWKIETTKNKKPSLCFVVWKCFAKSLITLTLMQLTVRLITTYWTPLAQSKLIYYFSSNQNNVTKSDAIYYACVVIGLKVFNLFYSNNYSLLVLALGLQVKAAVCSLIYRKSLKLNFESLSQVTIGKVTTILNKDVEFFQTFMAFAIEICIAIIQTGVTCYLIYEKIGIASWPGVTFFFIVLPVQMVIGKMTYNFRLKCNKKTDQRLELTQEVFSAIKIVKMYAWEKYFEEKICTARKKELTQLLKLFGADILITIIGNLCSKIAFFIFIITYVWMNANITAEIIFYILSCFNNLEGSLSNTLPVGFSQAAKLYATIQRCEDILHSGEKIEKCKKEESQESKITFTGVSVDKIFKNVSLTIIKGLNIVQGHTGSGKSTFLKTIMEECNFTGDVNVSGTISYASQEPWLFPSTVKNNILFGEPYCEMRYQKVLRLCCLDYDLNSFVIGDGTIVGDRGINLSKGQQTRINLARAVYKDSNIYLLDDCLASLDAHVSDQIFKNCICEFLENKLVIFVTNNIDYSQAADNIVVINQSEIKISKVEKKRPIDFIETKKDNRLYKVSGEINNHKEIYYEKKKSGKVMLRDYYQYIVYGGGIILFSLIMAAFLVDQFASSSSEKMMSNWITLEQNLININITNFTEYERLTNEKNHSLFLYSTTFLLSLLLTIISSLFYLWFARRVSINIHKAMLRSVMNSTMTFFDNTFIGNILTRFSKDCGTTDETVPFFILGVITLTFATFGSVALLTSVSKNFFFESLFLIIIAYFIKRFCQPTGRNLQRLHVIARSPMVGYVNSTLMGLSTIRASDAEDIVTDEFDRHQDLFTSAHYMLDNSMTALSFILEFFSIIFITSVIFQILFIDSGTDVGDVGLAINQSFFISALISGGVRTVFDCENLMTCVERMLEYVGLEQEEKSGIVIKDWPKNASVNFIDVSLNYSENNTLYNINFMMQPQEKLGIVGRTGAGKSSLISSLFRLYPFSGKITIDEVDIQKVSLNSLRSNISVIPQEPVLFTGTLRENLDPFNKYTDEQIWTVLQKVNLKTLVDNLNVRIDKGVVFSSGQKQLLCLARVILQNNKIVILDEATANVDQETDRLILETVRNHFAECTIIIIAHKLLSVLSCNNVVVLNDGRVSEYDKPEKLLKDKNSFFYSVIK